jgi:hypothetical protein
MRARAALALALASVAPLAAQSGQQPIQAIRVDLAEVIRRGPPARHALQTEIRPPGSRLSAAEKERLRQEAMRMPPSAALLARQAPTKQAPDFEAGFDSLDVSDCCSVDAMTPPDSHLAAGPDHLIATVNASFAIYDKAGTNLTGTILLSAFVSTANNDCESNPFDPNALYDEEADRFILAWDGNGTLLCIAVANQASPIGSWTVYSIPAQPRGGEFFDYPHLGVGDTHIVAGSNQFGGGVPGGFEGRVWAIDKAAAYAGTLSTFVTAPTGSDGTPQPLHLHGKLQGTWPSHGGTNYFVTDAFDGCTFDVWKWSPPTAPASIATFDLCTATGVAGGYPVPVPQSGTANLIEGNDWRARGFEYRNGSGWFADTISCNPGGGTVNCVRWAQVDLAPVTPTLTQAGVHSSAGVHRIFPDLAVDTLNNMAIGYSRSSSSTFPSVYFTGRESGEAPGTVQAEALLKAGEVAHASFDGSPFRWGDYSALTIDPNGATFWYIGEYSKNIVSSSNWGNWIGRFSYVLFADSFEVGSLAAWSDSDP